MDLKTYHHFSYTNCDTFNLDEDTVYVIQANPYPSPGFTHVVRRVKRLHTHDEVDEGGWTVHHWEITLRDKEFTGTLADCHAYISVQLDNRIAYKE